MEWKDVGSERGLELVMPRGEKELAKSKELAKLVKANFDIDRAYLDEDISI